MVDFMFVITNLTTEKNPLGTTLPQDHQSCKIWSSYSPWEEIGQDYACQSSISGSFQAPRILRTLPLSTDLKGEKNSKSKLVFIMELSSMSPGPLVESVEKMWKIQMMDGNPCKVVFTENNSDVKNGMMGGEWWPLYNYMYIFLHFLPSWALLLSLSEP